MSKKQTVLDLEREDDYLNRLLDELPKNKRKELKNKWIQKIIQMCYH